MKINITVFITLLGFTASWISIAFATESFPVNYGDCAYIKFEDVDPLELTQQERIDLLNADLFTSLDKSEKCMQKALVSSAHKISAVGADSGQGQGKSSASLDAANVGQVANKQAQSQVRPTSSSSSSNTDKKRGLNSGGSSAVCDAVNQGLTGATTDSEKEHFKGLKKQYGCK